LCFDNGRHVRGGNRQRTRAEKKQKNNEPIH
jgi:hypothetical protein